MAPHSDPATEVPEITEDTEQVEQGVDAEAEDEATGTGNEVKQAQNELQDLDTDNIIGGSNEGRTTRGNKGDPLAADKEVDAAVDDAAKQDEQTA
ncbi:unnamed protein product [Sympodiomycopsis kandeliae]